MDELEMIKVVAERKIGIPWEMLTEEQKAAIYRDYAGETDVLLAEYEQAVQEQMTEMPEGREVGGIFRASSPLETLGAVAQRGVGMARQKKVEEGLGDLSRDKAMGSRAAGEAAAYERAQQMQMLSNMLKTQAGQDTPQTGAAAPTAAPTPPPSAPVPSAPQTPPQAPPRPPMASAGTPPAPAKTMMGALLRQVGPGTEGRPAFDPDTFMQDYRPLTPEEEEERRRRFGRGQSRYHMYGEY